MRKADVTQEESVSGNLSYYCCEVGTAFEIANIEAVHRFLDVLKERKRPLVAVDLGAGDGAASNNMMPLFDSVTAVEVNPQKLNFIHATNLVCADMLVWLREQPDRSIPNIYTHHALEHVVEVESVLVEIARAMEPGGVYFAITPAQDHINRTHFIAFDSPEELLPPGFIPLQLEQLSRPEMINPSPEETSGSPDPEYLCVAVAP